MTIEDNSSNIWTEVIFTLLLLYLTLWEEEVVLSLLPIYRAWKGFRFEVLDTLEEKGLISQSRRAKSTDRGRHPQGPGTTNQVSLPADVQEPAITLALFLFRWYNKFSVSHVIYRAKGAKNHA